MIIIGVGSGVYVYVCVGGGEQGTFAPPPKKKTIDYI